MVNFCDDKMTVEESSLMGRSIIIVTRMIIIFVVIIVASGNHVVSNYHKGAPPLQTIISFNRYNRYCFRFLDGYCCEPWIISAPAFLKGSWWSGGGQLFLPAGLLGLTHLTLTYIAVSYYCNHKIKNLIIPIANCGYSDSWLAICFH